MIDRRLKLALLTLAALVLGALGSASLAVAAQADDACPNAAIRAQQHSEHLPDCRAYELVSPVDKNGYPVMHLGNVASGMSALSADGNRATFMSYGSFADSTSGMPTSYVADRTPAGWKTRAASPGATSPMPNVITGSMSAWRDADSALDFGLYLTTDSHEPDDPQGTPDLYRNEVGGPPVLVSRGIGSAHSGPYDAMIVAGFLDDGSHVLINTNAHLVPEDAGRVLGMDLYDRVDGTTHLVNQSSDGLAFGDCGAVAGGGAFGTSQRHAISADGRRVFFTVPDPQAAGNPECSMPSRVFQRIDNNTTAEISASQRTVADPGGPRSAVYEGAAKDGSRVIFRSPEMLTDSAQQGGGIYSYDVAAQTLTLLVESADAGVLKMSDDARTIYLTSFEQLDPEHASSGAIGLYVHRAGDEHPRWIVDDSAGDLGAMRGGAEENRPIGISSRGDLAFVTSSSLTGFDNVNPVSGVSEQEVFLYQLGSGSLTCVSCDPLGQRQSPVRSSARIIPRRTNYGEPRPSFSGDGSRLLFETGDQLVSGDSNARTDVYELSAGTLKLISSGTSDQDSHAVGISSDGSEVMFATYESLVGEDRDGGNEDMYVARTDGGFETAVADESQPCDGDACQGVAGAPSPAPRPSSEGLSSTAPAAPQRPKAALTVRTVAVPRGAALRTAASTGRIVVRVGVAGSTRGRVRAVLSDSSGRRVAVSGAQTASGPRSLAFTLRLSASARASLARKGRLALRAQVTIDGKAAAKSAALVLRRGHGGHR